MEMCTSQHDVHIVLSNVVFGPVFVGNKNGPALVIFFICTMLPSAMCHLQDQKNCVVMCTECIFVYFVYNTETKAHLANCTRNLVNYCY